MGAPAGGLARESGDDLGDGGDLGDLGQLGQCVIGVNGRVEAIAGDELGERRGRTAAGGRGSQDQTTDDAYQHRQGEP